MAKKNKIIKDLKRHRGGLLIGALTGVVAAYYLISQGYDLSSIITSGKGLIDAVMGRSTVVELATTKLYGVFIALGATLGYMVDGLITKFGPKQTYNFQKKKAQRRKN